MGEYGKLYVCATPIGNLEDMAARAIRVLGEVDLIAAEDTRKTRNLLTHFGIRNRLTSYHEHNELSKTGQLVAKLERGHDIALVTTAGTPGISDPGWRLIRASIDRDIPVEIVPGPSAAVAALTVSGLPSSTYLFLGFLPVKKGKRETVIREAGQTGHTLVAFESPRRVRKTLEEISDVLGDPQVALARELTKKFEQVLRGSATEVLKALSHNEPRGEIVLVIQGGSIPDNPTLDQLKETVLGYMRRGITKKDAIAKTAAALGVPKKRVYESVKTISGIRPSNL